MIRVFCFTPRLQKYNILSTHSNIPTVLIHDIWYNVSCVSHEVHPGLWFGVPMHTFIIRLHTVKWPDVVHKRYAVDKFHNLRMLRHTQQPSQQYSIWAQPCSITNTSKSSLLTHLNDSRVCGFIVYHVDHIVPSRNNTNMQSSGPIIIQSVRAKRWPSHS